MHTSSITVLGIDDASKKVEIIKSLRAITGIGPNEAKEIAEGRMALEMKSDNAARHLVDVLSQQGARAEVLPSDAMPAAPSFPMALLPNCSMTLSEDAAPTPKRNASQSRAVELGRAYQLASSFEARIRTTYSEPKELTAIAKALKTQRDMIRGLAEAMRAALQSMGIYPESEDVKYLLQSQHSQHSQQTMDEWLAKMPSQYQQRELEQWLNTKPGQSPRDQTLSLDSWLKKMTAANIALQRPLPWSNSGKQHRLREYRRNYIPLLAQQARFEQLLAHDARLSTALDESLSRLRGLFSEAWLGAMVDNPRAADIDWWIPAWAGRRLELDSGLHPTVSPAFIRLVRIATKVRFVAPDPSGRVYSEDTVLSITDDYIEGSATPRFQLEIDLDKDGGFASEDKTALETAAIDLLGQLPGGRVRVDVVDPLELGDSARFLFDLNDAGDRILADAIWTTAEHVANLLVRLEEHITFVTQKYLQGRNSLTEYNIEAGEIAEPYRLLILYDFPAGFSRDGKYFDQEQLSRLQRIATVGRRAGVYVFAHASLTQDMGPLDSLVKLSLGEFAVGDPSENRRLAAAAGLGDHARRGVAGSSALSVDLPRFTWEMMVHRPPEPEARRSLFAQLLRDLQHSDSARVEPSTITRLSEARYISDTQRGLTVEPIIDVDNPCTWWASKSTERLQLAFGRMGASDVARVEFNSALESSALIGGRTGSGKSYLIHALIMDAITRYSPEELTLYLCDLKEGVEFKQYADARLPHARAIAIESNREFTVSLLHAIDREITERGALFKAKAGGGAVNLQQFRKESGQVWPRVMIIIDEFHKLFEQDDQLAMRSMRLLERIIKEGRAFGVHTVLASQSLANVDSAFKSLAGQIPYRLVLASSDNDSRILLGDDNADAKLLTKAGEGILNAKGGARESNQRFQTTYWPPDQRQLVLGRVTELARRAGFERKPYVFEGNAEVRADDCDPNLYRGDGRSVVIPVGIPMSMGSPIVSRFERTPGSNLLIVDVQGLSVLAVLLTSLLAQEVAVTTVDFAAVEQEWEQAFDALTTEGLDKVNRRRIYETIDDLYKQVSERHVRGDYAAESRVLVLIGAHRARELDPDDYGDDTLLAVLRRLVKEGPEVGVHVVAWVDRKASLDRRFDSATVREFGLRFLGRMSEEDSRLLVDTEQAAAITPAQLVFDDFDNATTVIARRLGFPGPQWTHDIIGTRR